MGEMAAGNFASVIILRKGDELISIADKINVLNNSLKSTIGNQKSSMNKIVSELAELRRMVDSKPDNVSTLDSSIERLQVEIKDLENQLAKYKI